MSADEKDKAKISFEYIKSLCEAEIPTASETVMDDYKIQVATVKRAAAMLAMKRLHDQGNPWATEYLQLTKST